MRGRRSKPTNHKATVIVAVIAVLLVVVLGAVLLSRSGLFGLPSREELKRRVSELNEKAMRGKLRFVEVRSTLGLGDSTREEGGFNSRTHIWVVPERKVGIVCFTEFDKVTQISIQDTRAEQVPPPVPPRASAKEDEENKAIDAPVVENPGASAIRKTIEEVLNEMPESLWPNMPNGWDELREPRVIEWLRKEGFTPRSLETHGLKGKPFLTVVRVSNVMADYGTGKYQIMYTVSPCTGVLGTIQWKGVTFAVTWEWEVRQIIANTDNIFEGTDKKRHIPSCTSDEQVARQALKREGQFVLLRGTIEDLSILEPKSLHVLILMTPDPILDLEEKTSEKKR